MGSGKALSSPSLPPTGRATGGRFGKGNTASGKGGRTAQRNRRAREQMGALTLPLQPETADLAEWQEPFKRLAQMELQELIGEVAHSRGMRPDEIPHLDLRLCQMTATLVKQHAICVAEAEKATNAQLATEWNEKSLLFMRPIVDLLSKLKLYKSKEEAKRLKRRPTVDASAIPTRSALPSVPSGGHMPPPPIPPVRQGK